LVGNNKREHLQEDAAAACLSVFREVLAKLGRLRFF
jgi:hypothetical protein